MQLQHVIAILYKALSIGTHCCLWCGILSDQLHLPRKVIGYCKERLLQSFKEDQEVFVAAGGDLQKAKEFNNVITPYLFGSPLDQVRTSLFHCHIGLHY